jgi:hypothetical protein
MASSFTTVASRTSTFTEARVRYIMNKVFDDLVMVTACDFATVEQVTQWAEEITAILLLEAAELFQVKFRRPDGVTAAITYTVSDDGSLAEDGSSGGVNYFAHPAGTKASIVIRLRAGARKHPEAVDYLKGRGWTFNGTILEDAGTRDRAYSSNGYGVARALVGKWQ